MKAEDVKTLEQFALFINEQDEWKTENSEIIKRNRWNDLTGSTFNICQDDKGRVLAFNDSFTEAVIVE